MNKFIITKIYKYNLTTCTNELLYTYYTNEEKATDIWNLYVTNYEQNFREAIYSTDEEKYYEQSVSYQDFDVIYTIIQERAIIDERP